MSSSNIPAGTGRKDKVRLTAAQCRRIHEAKKMDSSISLKELQKRFGVSRAVINAVLRGDYEPQKNWWAEQA